MSPGGRILNSLRSRPLEPPSSVTVTTAVRSPIAGASSLDVGEGTSIGLVCAAYFFNPRRRVDRPVPPPIATTRSGSGIACIPSMLRPREEDALDSEELPRLVMLEGATVQS